MRIIGGTFRGRRLMAPLEAASSKATTRPTTDRTRETLFNFLLHNPTLNMSSLAGCHVLDCFAGTGALGLEALSRGASHVTFIENNPQTLRVLRHNVELLGAKDHTRISPISVLNLAGAREVFQLVFLDPPYHGNLVKPTLEVLRKKGWIDTTSLIVVEAAIDEMVALPQGFHISLERNAKPAKIMFLKYEDEVL